ncbi:hypothetical protein B0H15DRAFT_791165 [Mycena belliarum]|uniref:Uncharacterized protein n=1 Tax=Mycena belliarum TaxID=1033014 RepID=A0AAD6XHX8_9AGAR|nr:hypothetical protein B0H15DRAFT_791165 [Mycena belliae]
MTPAYVFTDYKSQGQTLEYVLINLEKPPTHKLTPFSTYMALSRSRGRDRIRLLRGFETSLFTTHPSEDLREIETRGCHWAGRVNSGDKTYLIPHFCMYGTSNLQELRC